MIRVGAKLCSESPEVGLTSARLEVSIKCPKTSKNAVLLNSEQYDIFAYANDSKTLLFFFF